MSQPVMTFPDKAVAQAILGRMQRRHPNEAFTITESAHGYTVTRSKKTVDLGAAGKATFDPAVVSVDLKNQVADTVPLAKAAKTVLEGAKKLGLVPPAIPMKSTASKPDK